MIHRICIGFDDAQPLSYNVAQFSALRHASQPLAITPMVLETLPIKRRGLTKFSFSRFLVPYLMGFKGWALWMDSDIIFNADPVDLWDYAKPDMAVVIADTKMAFERSAMILFNCSHPDNRKLTPEYIETASDLHTIGWTKNIGHFPSNWCHLVGYDDPSTEVNGIHYTQGVPSDQLIRDCEHADKWLTEFRLMNSTKSWVELMGESVHAVQTESGPAPKYKAPPALTFVVA